MSGALPLWVELVVFGVVGVWLAWEVYILVRDIFRFRRGR